MLGHSGSVTGLWGDSKEQGQHQEGLWGAGMLEKAGAGKQIGVRLCKTQAILVLGSGCLRPDHIPARVRPAARRPLPSGHLSLTLVAL